MDIKIANKISELTENNNHTEARIEIASRYSYLDKYLNLFLAISVIHRIEGSIPFGVMNYRDNLTDRMLKEIETREGKKEAEQIYQLI